MNTAKNKSFRLSPNLKSKKEKKNAEKAKKMSLLYDTLYEKASLIIAKYNPCSFKNGECFNYGCCYGCKHLSENGCTVKALSCKLWLCDEARLKFPECATELDALEKEADENKILLGYRSCKKEVFLLNNLEKSA